MAILAVQKVSQTGLAPAYLAADVAGDEWTNGGRSMLHVKNGSAAAVTVTIDSVKSCDQGFDHDVQVSVPAGSERLIGPFEPRRFNNASGRCKASYSAVASVTVAALEV
ncbi:hypothetical protein [Geobacter sp.]|uniref:hypothetical protein n=1 Tax=Geobacter sp. TaxID=46610 RepID=UPI0026189AD4|nr:hypothetical protein [Geobacter sp.]